MRIWPRTKGHTAKPVFDLSSQMTSCDFVNHCSSSVQYYGTLTDADFPDRHLDTPDFPQEPQFTCDEVGFKTSSGELVPSLLGLDFMMTT